MVKKRLIASLILNDGMVIQSIKFKLTNIIHRDPSVAVEHFNKWAIDELLVIDVSRENSNRKTFLSAVDKLSNYCFVPLTVGGWISSLEDIRQLQLIGADKISINTHAFQNPEFISLAADKFGSQCIVVSIDVKTIDNEHIVFIDRGRYNTEVDVVNWAKKVADMGAGEILLTSIDHDGDRKGYDIDLMKKVTKEVNIPVIAFGGVSRWEHFYDGFIHGGVDAVSAANVFHYVDNSAKKAKAYLRDARISIR